MEFNILETFPLHLQTLADSNEDLWGNVIFVRQAAQVERRAIGMRKKSYLVSVELWLKHAITFMALRPAVVVAIVYDFCTAPPHIHTYTGVVVSLRLARSKSLSLRLGGEGRPRVGVGHQRCLSPVVPPPLSPKWPCKSGRFARLAGSRRRRRRRRARLSARRSLLLLVWLSCCPALPAPPPSSSSSASSSSSKLS